jgi:hypothetical protein
MGNPKAALLKNSLALCALPLANSGNLIRRFDTMLLTQNRSGVLSILSNAVFSTHHTMKEKHSEEPVSDQII